MQRYIYTLFLWLLSLTLLRDSEFNATSTIPYSLCAVFVLFLYWLVMTWWKQHKKIKTRLTMSTTENVSDDVWIDLLIWFSVLPSWCFQGGQSEYLRLEYLQSTKKCFWPCFVMDCIVDYFRSQFLTLGNLDKYQE